MYKMNGYVRNSHDGRCQFGDRTIVITRQKKRNVLIPCPISLQTFTVDFCFFLLFDKCYFTWGFWFPFK